MEIFTDISNAIDKVEWNFESHDPVWAWFIVGMYSISALLCLRALFYSQRSLFPDAIRKRCKLFWAVLFCVMLFLACNKQLDIQTYITAVAREVANAEGWYEQRRTVQREVIIVLGLLAFLFLSFLVYVVYYLPTSYKISLVGALFTFTFIGMRASSFHHLDHFVAEPIYGVKLHILIEIFGSVIVTLGAFLSVRGINKWELYYDNNYTEGGGHLINPDFDLDSDVDSEQDESIVPETVAISKSSMYSVSKVKQKEIDTRDSLFTQSGSVEQTKAKSGSKGNISDLITDIRNKSSKETPTTGNLFDMVSNPKYGTKNIDSVDNSSPRISRESISEANRVRRELKRNADLGGSAAAGYSKSDLDKKNREDNWLSKEDETGWI